MVTFIKGNIVRESHQVLGNIIGEMEATLKVNLKQGWEMGREYGKDLQEIAINMRDNIKMIKSKDMGYLVGQQEISIKGIIN